MNIQVEIIEAKEHAEHRSGVYAIVQPKEKKVYVGLALDFYHRWLSHINSIASGENKRKTKYTRDFYASIIPQNMAFLSKITRFGVDEYSIFDRILKLSDP